MATGSSVLDKKTMLWLYRTMVTIRQFEERARREADAGKPIGGIHSSVGQEAVAVGVCAHLRRDDYVLGNHRSHHHCLAKGLDMNKMMAELMGKAGGTNKGKGGTMHIADIEMGMLGANGVVASNVPVATGAALSAKVRGTDQVTAVFFGDGGANQGAIHESMNLAAIWKLPVVFLCENNRYAESTPVDYALAGGSVARRGAAYGIPGVQVDGQDVLAVYEAAGEAVRRARAGEGPSLLEALTYRYYGHFGADNPLTYRTQEEEEYYRSRDCLETFKAKLLEDETATEQELEAIDQKVLVALDGAVKFADESPWPGPEELVSDVYVNYP
ncbi:MAG: thiamine pyrophosphate-dependent dehydrogenase E1 component subunit alpha [Dehalococcoidia bacterium]